MTYDIDQLRELERRLSEAKGPDRKIDAMIELLLCPCEPPDCNQAIMVKIIERVLAGGEDSEINLHTASLDAAIALVERVRPGHEWKAGVDLEIAKAWAAVGDTHWDECFFDATAEAPTPALALCLALVRALIAKEGK